MKYFFIAALILITVPSILCQNYTWKTGSSLTNQLGVYGIQGVSSPINQPGSRQHACSWKDNSGDLWIFGGYGYDDSMAFHLNDLWRFRPQTNEWTFMKGDTKGILGMSAVVNTQGIPHPSNKPGCRYYASSWTDLNGNLWLFGGYNTNSGNLNDLWKYDVQLNQWARMKGNGMVYQLGVYGTQGISTSNTTPGSRRGAVTWTDNSGNLWLFGGYGVINGFNSFCLNDLWKYSISTNEWTWVNGSNTANPIGNYGTQGVSAPSNTPGGRMSAQGWTDISGNLWMFGGTGVMFGSQLGLFADLWKYNPSSNEWTFMKGGSNANTSGSYGQQGTSSLTNNPGARSEAMSWIDQSGDLWLFGGGGYSSNGLGVLNDMWKFSISSNAWTWMKGSNSAYSAPIYGIQNISHPQNDPGRRLAGNSWVDNFGSVWIFGGNKTDSASTSAVLLNDMWRFGSCINQPISIASSSMSICEGESAVLSANGALTYSWSTTQIGASITVSPAVTNIYTVTNTSHNSCLNTATITQIVLPKPHITLQSTDTLLCLGESATLTANGANAYAWSPEGSGSYVVITPSSAAVFYTVTGTDLNGCKNSAMVTQSVSTCNDLIDVIQEKHQFKVFPNPSNGIFTIKNEYRSQLKHNIEIYNKLGILIAQYSFNEERLAIDLTNESSGIYFIRMISDNGISVEKIIKL